jgi:tetratricopeptide (TPR) repeat protein
VAGATGYRLSLTLADGESWSRETAAAVTTLAYPPDTPPLIPGSANIVELSALNQPADTDPDKSVLRLLPGAELEALAKAEASIEASSLTETSRGILLAQLYRQRGLWAAAHEQLERLALSEQPPSASLWQQVGDLYLEMGLAGQAETSYQQALSVAASNADPSTQAATHLGLARAALAFSETTSALDHLTAAEALYRQAGQPDLAEQVVAEREKLK